MLTFCLLLYILSFLHQTATLWEYIQYSKLLYILSFLHQTATAVLDSFVMDKLYILSFLHQTATASGLIFVNPCCISYLSYIKPQHLINSPILCTVVYLIFPTSNRNLQIFFISLHQLYILSFLHQTATIVLTYIAKSMLYILSFLHQTATAPLFIIILNSCISYLSYIKPQLASRSPLLQLVVYLIFPTSNRNLTTYILCSLMLYILSFLHQTATAMVRLFHRVRLYILSFLHQTATICYSVCQSVLLYILSFLHQTATIVY